VGEGSFGTVYKAQDVDTGALFAVKEVLFEGNEESPQIRQLCIEVDIYKSLCHPNIVRYLGQEINKDSMCLFLEYVAGGSVMKMLRDFGPLQGKVLQKATHGALEGLAYLHNHNPPVVHRDIKGANLLVDTDCTVKLADFGCSKQAASTGSFKVVGSLPWMAPEVIMQEHGHGRKADIWSMGCTVLEMATAAQPWGTGKFENVMSAIRTIGMTEATPPVPEDLPHACQDLVRCCTTRDPHCRPTAEKALGHNFLVQ